MVAVTTVHVAVAGDDPIARGLLLLHLEVGAAVGLEAVEFDEGAGIKEQFRSLAGGELALFVVLFNTIQAAPLQSFFITTREFL